MSCCNAIDSHFSEKHADRDLKRYLEHGPDPTTTFLIAAVRCASLDHPTLTDVGAGIGTLQHELLTGDVSCVTHVDASPYYLKTAREECERRGHGDFVTFVEADVVDVDPGLASADVVLMDRVVCCYPDYDELIEKTTALCRRLYAISYPRSNPFTRLLFWLDNKKRLFQGLAFRAKVHATSEVEARIIDAGFELISEEKTLVWRVVAFKRRDHLSDALD